ncbi:MAG: sporulation transcriptional regulator SpoIIID [Clostridia bacterium]|nr:sporulation transcriptional regulator SpoIIID [Clostridia bacterium]MBR4033988.1 sporulation transcriptional regulator SpoIIID [Clostridia bacterium]
MVYISVERGDIKEHRSIGRERCVELGAYIIEHNTTVRATAQKFGISKSTVHKDVTEILKRVNPSMCAQVREILEINKQERHLRGGEATRRKYQGEKEENDQQG